MINLTSSGNSVTFSFSGQSGYLNNGEIVVPKNSLSLVLDTSDMAVFKKSNSDVFVAALVSDFGMTKDELEAWYKENMVGSTGGGGGITSGEVQTMIDDAVSVKLDASAYTPTVVDSTFDSGSTNPLANSAITTHLNDVESIIATSLVDLDNRKLDASAYTPTDLSNYYTSAQTESAITAAVSGKQDTLIAGSGISIDTANTISCTLPISVPSSNQYSIRVGNGNGNNASANNCIIAGESVSISYKNSIGVGSSIQIGSSNSVGVGRNISTSNENEFAGGFYNVSNKVNTTRGDSGNTLFSVGNGYIHNLIQARHNAFEIRQNGDLYVADVDDTTYSNYYEKPMKRLQDYIQFKIVKLSQSEYDALVQAGTVDANTVYFITSSNS